MATIEARVRYHSNTYLASGGSPRKTASSTAGHEHAARALARKLFPDTACSVQFVGLVGEAEVWRIGAAA